MAIHRKSSKSYYFILLSSLAAPCIAVSAPDLYQDQNLVPNLGVFSQGTSSHLSFTQGIANRSASWAISTSSQDDRTLSKLDYKDQEIQTLSIGIDLTPILPISQHDWHSFGKISFGVLKNGQLVDSDFNGPGAGVHTQSLAKIEGSKSYGITLGMAKDISHALDGSRTFQVGLQWFTDRYHQHSAELNVSNGQTLTTPTSIANLDSRYDAHWFGPMLGVTQTFHFGNQELALNLEVQAASYFAEGRWNLRSDLAQPKSFEQAGWSAGWGLKLDHQIHLLDNASFTQSLGIANSQLLSGQDRLLKASGRSVVTDLQEVSREELHYSIGMEWRL